MISLAAKGSSTSPQTYCVSSGSLQSYSSPPLGELQLKACYFSGRVSGGSIIMSFLWGCSVQRFGSRGICLTFFVEPKLFHTFQEHTMRRLFQHLTNQQHNHMLGKISFPITCGHYVGVTVTLGNVFSKKGFLFSSLVFSHSLHLVRLYEPCLFAAQH